MEHSESFLDVGDVRLRVLTAGQGEPVLLLHGFPDSAALWRDVAPALAGAGYRVVIPDQRGFAASSVVAGSRAYALEVLAADMIALLDDLGIESTRVVGHDWGSAVGWKLAGIYPDRVTSLVSLSFGHPEA